SFDHGLHRQHIAKFFVLRNEESLVWRVVHQNEQGREVEQKEHNEQAPMLHADQEQEDARDEREIDLQITGQAEQTDHQRMPKKDQDAERNCADVLSIAVQLGNERRHQDHKDVVNVDGKQAIEIMQ